MTRYQFIFVGLLGFSAYLKQWCFDQCAATHDCLATDLGHDTPPCHSIYRHRADLSLCYPLMWNFTLEYTNHFNILGQTRSGRTFLTFHTHQRTLNFMMLIWWWSVRSLVENVQYPPSLEPGNSGVRIHYAIRMPTAASLVYIPLLLTILTI